eukprot:649678-Rhodomonas_salina.1
MASKASKTQGVGMGGGVTAQAQQECRLLLLPSNVLGLLWPPERVVVGLRVCKSLRKDLIAHCGSILLVQKTDEKHFGCRLSEDFGRLPSALMVTLKWKAKDQVTRLLGMLGECKGLAHLNLRENKLGAKGAGRLAEVLGECKALATLDLSLNRIGVEGAGRLVG